MYGAMAIGALEELELGLLEVDMWKDDQEGQIPNEGPRLLSGATPQLLRALARKTCSASGGGGGGSPPTTKDPCDPSNFDDYARSANQSYNSTKNSPTNAGRALQKHSGRGQGFPDTSAMSPGDINAAAQEIIEEILTNPASQCFVDSKGRTNVRLPNGQGARWDSNGNFIGLIGP
jgi:hypothetical protein